MNFPSKLKNMDLITKTPGYHHIAEQIFSYLDVNSLLKCQKVNDYWWNILVKPWFWFNRMKRNTKLSNEHQNEWIRFCEMLSKVNLTKDMTPALNYIYGLLENSVTLDETFWIAIKCEGDLSDLYEEIVRIMAPLIENPNAPRMVDINFFSKRNNYNCTPIYFAAHNGSTEIVKILAPLTDNPNAPNEEGETPIYMAACSGHVEIVKILAPFTDNPNAPDNNGLTPIYWAAYFGHTEVVKILAPLTVNPNALDGSTAIYGAACNGHTEIVNFLAPLTDNPNAPNGDGNTPIYGAAKKGHTEIVKFLAPLTDNPNAPNNDGKTPASVAKNAEIRRILKAYKKSKTCTANAEPPTTKSAKRLRKK